MRPNMYSPIRNNSVIFAKMAECLRLEQPENHTLKTIDWLIDWLVINAVSAIFSHLTAAMVYNGNYRNQIETKLPTKGRKVSYSELKDFSVSYFLKEIDDSFEI